ncbi:hypothetical protein DFJ74DRAFT_713289 [Hyaloraphidium curvatum]|nr:hypothetical protein DFJ74DRAFT_713289 [Hyaloraphidium curvatum]
MAALEHREAASREPGPGVPVGTETEADAAGPLLPPVVLRAVFEHLEWQRCNKTLAECAVASRETSELAFPILYRNLEPTDAMFMAFEAILRNKGDLVKVLILNESKLSFPRMEFCLKQARSVVDLTMVLNRRSQSDPGAVFGLLAGMPSLEDLFVYDPHSLHGLKLPKGLRRFAVSGVFWVLERNGSADPLFAALNTLGDDTEVYLGVLGNLNTFAGRMASSKRLPRLVKWFHADAPFLQGAEKLFAHPLFRPDYLEISFHDPRAASTALPGFLAGIRPLRVLALVSCPTGRLPDLLYGLPAAGTIRVGGASIFKGSCPASLEPAQLEEFEAALVAKYRDIRVDRMEFVRGPSSEADAAEEAMWTRVTRGRFRKT